MFNYFAFLSHEAGLALVQLRVFCGMKVHVKIKRTVMNGSQKRKLSSTKL